MLPFYYPTTVLAVDDDHDFLASFEYRYRRKFRCQVTSSANVAIDLIARDEEKFGKANILNQFGDIEGEEGPHVVALRLSEIGAMSEIPNHTKKISVVVVDYAMPEMTGIEFCRAIADYNVKRLLLTGKAGLEIAVDAFNEGLIESFVLKGSSDVGAKIDSEIKKLQNAFFKDMAAPITSIENLNDLQFFRDENFRQLFARLKDEFDISEHFLSAAPPGLITVSHDGVKRILLVCSKDIMRAQYETALHAEAPSDLLTILESKSGIVAFPAPMGFYEERFLSSWRDYIWPAQPLAGSECWWWAMTEPVSDLTVFKPR